MDKFATLEPVRLYTPSGKALAPTRKPLIGRLPVDLHELVLVHLAISDIPAYARASRALAALARDDGLWHAKWRAFGVEEQNLVGVLDELEERGRAAQPQKPAGVAPTLKVDEDDDFGDFAAPTSGNALGLVPMAGDDEMGEFVGTFNGSLSVSNTPAIPSFAPAIFTSQPVSKSTMNNSPYRAKFIRAHTLLQTCLPALRGPAHLVLPTLFPPPVPSSQLQSSLLRLLALWLSPRIQPVSSWDTLRQGLRAAADRFDATVLAEFDFADTRGDEDAMRAAASASWSMWEMGGQSTGAEWELARVWAEKREVFYEQGKWKAEENVTSDGTLDFGPMDAFMQRILRALEEDGARSVRVFPPAAQVILSFADRIASELMSEYVVDLLTRARAATTETFLKASAAAFRESWKLVDGVLAVSGTREDAKIPQTKAEDVIYKMFEINMDDYLEEEVEFVKLRFQGITKAWNKSGSISSQKRSSQTTTPDGPRFLAAQDPAQMKRTLISSFTDVLLLPVTIVPRAAGAVGAGLVTAGGAAVQGIGMLDPRRWGGNAGAGSTGTQGDVQSAKSLGYGREVGDDGVVFDLGEDEDEEEKKDENADRASIMSASSTLAPSTTTATTVTSASQNESFELFLSLDVALELIHASRESLKRCETFAGYPGHYGHRVRDTLEEIFVLFLQGMEGGHLGPGFGAATERMRAYKPADHSDATSVAPLVQFFELVHVGDTIQSMVQVYFEKELAPHIDRTDFLNAVVREKKRFENQLDEAVAAGLNAGTEVLMNQVEHIILTRTQAREYYPPEDAPLDLGATKGCIEAIKCLEKHCALVRDTTSKDVLEVFYQEIGFRLIAILQKHIKRQIISLSGGFQLIADLNAYHAFITSLRVPSVAAEFSHLKMLGHVYVVEDAVDLAQIVRDVTRYGGAYRPEDIYEFIQRRSDWKKIEKTVDKTMYNLSFKEDCTIC